MNYEEEESFVTQTYKKRAIKMETILTVAYLLKILRNVSDNQTIRIQWFRHRLLIKYEECRNIGQSIQDSIFFSLIKVEECNL